MLRPCWGVVQAGGGGGGGGGGGRGVSDMSTQVLVCSSEVGLQLLLHLLQACVVQLLQAC